MQDGQKPTFGQLETYVMRRRVDLRGTTNKWNVIHVDTVVIRFRLDIRNRVQAVLPIGFRFDFHLCISLCAVFLFDSLLIFTVIVTFDFVLEATILDIVELIIILDLVSPFISLVEGSRNGDGGMPLHVSYQDSDFGFNEARPDLVGLFGRASSYHCQIVLVVSGEKGMLSEQIFPRPFLELDILNNNGTALEFALDDSLGRVGDVKRRTHLRISWSDDWHQMVLVTSIHLIFR